MALEQQLDTLARTVFSGVEPSPNTGGGELVAHLAALHAATRPELAQAWHDAIDRAEASAYSPLTIAEFTKQETALVDGIRDRELELERRRIAARQAEADQELAQLEAGATR